MDAMDRFRCLLSAVSTLITIFGPPTMPQPASVPVSSVPFGHRVELSAWPPENTRLYVREGVLTRWKAAWGRPVDDVRPSERARPEAGLPGSAAVGAGARGISETIYVAEVRSDAGSCR
jgi:hypothetical protein